MGLGEVLTVLVVGLLIGLASGIPVALVLIAIGIAAFFVGEGAAGLFFLASLPWEKSSSFDLISIPLFVLMGHLLQESGFIRHLFRMLSFWTSWVPGSLGVVALLTSGVFAAMCGSGAAAAASLGTVLAPEVRRYHYPMPLMMGILNGGASLAPIIPPSMAFIIYGTLAEVSITRMFAAGVVPGIVIMMVMIAYVVSLAVLRPTTALRPASATWKERLVSLWALAASAVLIFLVLGGLFMGWHTPSEAAALGVVVAFVYLAVGHIRKWRTVWHLSRRALQKSALVASFVLLLVLGGFMYSHTLAFFRVPQIVGGFLADTGLPAWQFIGVLTIILLVLGSFIDGITMQVITVPFVAPLLMQMNIDLIWFGVYVVFMVEIGTLTPPFGLHLFILQGTMNASYRDAVVGAAPFVVLWLFVVALLVLFPELATWLPGIIV